MPDELAATVLGICYGLVTDEVRGFAGFDPAVEVGETAGATEKLVTFRGALENPFGGRVAGRRWAREGHTNFYETHPKG